MHNNMEEKKYLFSSGGIIEAPEEWLNGLKEDEFTDSYVGLLEGKYMQPTEQQLEFYSLHKDENYDLYHQFYMIELPMEELNEKIRKNREMKYSAQSDKLYMAYIKYKEFGEIEKAEEAYHKWKEMVLNIEKTNPYFL